MYYHREGNKIELATYERIREKCIRLGGYEGTWVAIYGDEGHRPLPKPDCIKEGRIRFEDKLFLIRKIEK